MLICRSLFRKTDRIIPLLFVFLFFSLTAPPFAAPADRKLTAAVVAGFMSPFQEIAAAFEKETGISIDVSFTSGGRIYAQIENGAPYDIFLSADVERPALLYGKSLCEKPFVYAEGEVILWSADRRFCTSAGWQEALKRKEIQKIAIPNPQTAVHGTHAKKALEEAGLWKDLAPKLVVAQDIAQVFQYATIGAVKYGVMIDGPEHFAGSASWADAVFATGSTAVNGTLQGIVAARPDTVFYGVTITGVARLTGLRQFCYIMDAKGV